MCRGKNIRFAGIFKTDEKRPPGKWVAVSMFVTTFRVAGDTRKVVMGNE